MKFIILLVIVSVLCDTQFDENVTINGNLLNNGDFHVTGSMRSSVQFISSPSSTHTITLDNSNSGKIIDASTSTSTYVISITDAGVGSHWRVLAIATTDIDVQNTSGKTMIASGSRVDDAGTTVSGQTSYSNNAQISIMEPETLSAKRAFYNIHITDSQSTTVNIAYNIVFE